MKNTPIKYVCFFGFAEAKETDADYIATFESAKLLAEAGYTIVNGGGPGIMEAATKGAHAGGGKAIGVTLYPDGTDDLVNFEGRSPGNNFDEEVKEGSYLARTLKLIDLGDIFVVMNGGTGTVSEFGMAWGLARLEYGHHEDLILYGQGWHQIMEAFATNMSIREEAFDVYHIVDTPEAVLERVKHIDGLRRNERQ